MTNNQARNIIYLTLLNKGGTFKRHNGRGVKPARGYAVSLFKDSEFRVKVNSLTERIVRWYDSTLPKGVQYLGTWIDGDTVYLDAATVVNDFSEAKRLGVEHEQACCYCFATGNTIYF